jgi:murein DD-endopeptidase MepM/ murein hydrolase activator NlpD
MRSYHRSLLVFSLLLCTVAVFPAWSAGAESGSAGEGTDKSTDNGISARVARLYEDTTAMTRQYETGRREAEKQHAIAVRDEKLLVEERKLIAALHTDLGRIARAQYQQSGGLILVMHTLHPDSTQQLTQDHEPLVRLDLAVANAVVRSHLAETRLTGDRARALAQWRALQKRNEQLVAGKRTLQTKLEEARVVLQRQADASAAAGKCRGAVHLGLPRPKLGRPWVAPVEEYRLTAGFGNGGEHWAHRHTGQDFAVPIGTPVRAVGLGKVVHVTCGGAFGIEIVIKQSGGYYTQYAHLAAVTVVPGDRVSTGQCIGQSGTTGNSTGPHLHFEVRVTPQFGSAIDPVPWLRARGVKV